MSDIFVYIDEKGVAAVGATSILPSPQTDFFRGNKILFNGGYEEAIAFARALNEELKTSPRKGKPLNALDQIKAETTEQNRRYFAREERRAKPKFGW